MQYLTIIENLRVFFSRAHHYRERQRSSYPQSPLHYAGVTGVRCVAAQLRGALVRLNGSHHFERLAMPKLGHRCDLPVYFNLKNAVEFVNPPNLLSFSIITVFPGHPFGALKTAAVAQLQGARCDGMAHAISSFVQRRRWATDAVFRFKTATVDAAAKHCRSPIMNSGSLPHQR